MEYLKSEGFLNKLKDFMTTRNGYILSCVISMIGFVLAIRALFKTKHSLMAMISLANATFSAYSIFKTSKKILKG